MSLFLELFYILELFYLFLAKNLFLEIFLLRVSANNQYTQPTANTLSRQLIHSASSRYHQSFKKSINKRFVHN
jgi:hypothetical protein